MRWALLAALLPMAGCAGPLLSWWLVPPLLTIAAVYGHASWCWRKSIRKEMAKTVRYNDEPSIDDFRHNARRTLLTATVLCLLAACAPAHEPPRASDAGTYTLRFVPPHPMYVCVMFQFPAHPGIDLAAYRRGVLDATHIELASYDPYCGMWSNNDLPVFDTPAPRSDLADAWLVRWFEFTLTEVTP